VSRLKGEEDLQVGPSRVQALRDFGTAHSRHDDVHQRQRDRTLMGLGDLQGFLAARGPQHLISVGGQAVADRVQHDGLIIDNQDGRAAGAHR